MKKLIAGVISILAFGSAAGFAQTDKSFCSEIKFPENRGVLYVDEPVEINVEVNEGFKKYKIKYLWTASGGKITRGQNTSAIELTPGAADNDNNIFVTVKLDGLPENCLDTNTHTFAVTRYSSHPWFDMFGKLPKNDVYGRLDNYFVALINDPTAEGVIILEFAKTETRAKKIKRLKEVLAHVNYRKLPKSRLEFLISEADEEYTRLFIVPQGKKISDVRDDTESYDLLKGEEIEQKIKELFPPKKK